MPTKGRVPLREHRAYQIVLAVIVISQVADVWLKITDDAGWGRIAWDAVQVAFFALVLVISISERLERDRRLRNT